MHRRASATLIAAVGGLLGVLAPAGQARACGTGAYDEVIVPALALGFLVPSEIGAAVSSTTTADGTRFVLGWSWQIPLTGLASTGHRIVPSVDLRLGNDGASWQGRLGYRYARHHAFAGAGIGLDGAGVNLSPEIGVKFAHDDMHDREFDLSMHLLARAAIAPETGQVRGATILLGWNLF